jgi:hypothetical protein
MLRQLWSIIESTHTHIILALDDLSLIDWILSQLQAEQSIDSNEADIYSRYIRSKLSLIRDLAQVR